MIYIVIPVYNRAAFTRACLLSLRDQTCKDFSIVVIDDGSTDGTEEMIKQEFPEVVLLHGDGNLWWTGATNRGVRYVLGICGPTDYVLALNNDLIVPPDYISTFTNLSANFPNTLIGSVVTDIDDIDTICSGGVKINWKTAKLVNLNTGKKRSSFPQGFFTEVSILTGRGVLIPSQVFREIGLYNERHYPLYGDTELPKRAEKAGYKLIVSYDVAVYSHWKDPNNINHQEKYGLADIKKYFWNIRSKSDLRCRFWFAYDTSSNILQGTRFLILNMIRTIYGFVKRFKIGASFNPVDGKQVLKN